MAYATGEWTYAKTSYLIGGLASTYEISNGTDQFWIAHALHEDDAKLICAAPKMLAKLKQYVELIPDRDAINLIAKAEGRS